MDRPLPQPAFWQRKKVRVAALAALVMAAVLLLARHHTASSSLPVEALRFEQVTARPLDIGVAGFGVLTPARQNLSTAPAQAMVEQLMAKAGTQVAKGDLLMRLNSPALGQALQEARALARKARSEAEQARLADQIEALTVAQSLAALEAQLDLDHKELDAKMLLLAEGMVAKLDLERLRTKLDLLKQQITRARASNLLQERLRRQRLAILDRQASDAEDSLARTEQQVGALEVRAADTGTVDEVFVALGQAVAPGEKLLRLVNQEQLLAEIRVPQAQAAAIALDAPATLTVQNKPVPARVTRIDPAVRDGTVLVELSPQRALPAGVRSGQAANAEIVPNLQQTVLSLPNPERWTPYEERAVFVLAAAGRLERRAVRLGAAVATPQGERIEVRAGLAAQDRVALRVPSSFYHFTSIALTK
jgi:multidrug efflux pump subunit AcrA (membrane-fusion protein)